MTHAGRLGGRVLTWALVGLLLVSGGLRGQTAISEEEERQQLVGRVRPCQPEALQRMLPTLRIALDAPEPGTGKTALHYAVEGGELGCLKILLEAGSKPTVPDAKGRTALQLADAWPKRESLPQAKLLLFTKALGRADPRATTGQSSREGPTRPPTLHEVALRGQVEMAAMLLRLGADPNATEEEGRYGTRQEKQAGTGTKEASGNRPLQLAALKGHAEMVTLLLRAKARVDLANGQGFLPLHDAALGGSAEVVRRLVTAGAVVDAPATGRGDGQTALQIAAAFGNREAVMALLAAGADPAKRDGRGRTAAELAEAAGQAELARLLRERARTERR